MIHLLNEETWQLWCGTRKLHRDDQIVPTKRYDRELEDSLEAAEEGEAAGYDSDAALSFAQQLTGALCLKCQEARTPGSRARRKRWWRRGE